MLKIFTNLNKISIKKINTLVYFVIFNMLILLFSIQFVIGQNYLSVKGYSINVGGKAYLGANNIILEQDGKINLQSDDCGVKLSENIKNNSGNKHNFGKGNIIFQSNNEQNISGSDVFKFNNLVLKTKELILSNNIEIAGMLAFDYGDLNLVNNNLYLLNSGFLFNETNKNRVKANIPETQETTTGKIIANVNLNNGLNVNVAGMGIDIYSETYTGEKTIQRLHKELNVNNNVSIKRSFILPFFGDLNESNYINLSYFTDELNELNEASLSIYSVNDFNQEVIESYNDFNNKKVNARINNGTDLKSNSAADYQLFTLLNFQNQKPDIIANNIDVYDNMFDLTWKLNLDISNYEYEVLIKEKGTEDFIPYYSFISINNNLSETIYKTEVFKNIENVSEIMLKQYFPDGNLKDEIIIKNSSPNSPEQFNVYFDFAFKKINIYFLSNENSKYNLQILNSEGKIIAFEQLQINEGENNFSFNTSRYSDGVYIVKISNYKNSYTKKIMIFN